MQKKIFEKPKVFSIYMNAQEYKEMQLDAKEMGYSLSAFIRELWKDYKQKKGN